MFAHPIQLFRATAGLAGFLALAACAGQTPPEETVGLEGSAAASAIPPLGTDEILSRLGVLPPQRLDKGKCGLFLWLKRPDAPLVFFQRSDGVASVALDGKVQSPHRTEKSAPITMQYFEDQTFRQADMTIKVTVQPESLRSLQQGLKLPTGSMSVATDAGWSAVLPVAGVIGCK
ncbi:MAG: hypothetical protein EP335_03935 [Alphaproteobacteria bacterium]|nr:MAG: hypothetical protein EP335_03935 [Alphaproteobacteria bacterium]